MTTNRLIFGCVISGVTFAVRRTAETKSILYTVNDENLEREEYLAALETAKAIGKASVLDEIPAA